ncbi:MAG: cysteine ABC transporter substrate-binding protein [Clostridium sp.]|uniref:cysteine ABC transporter substrate-binding protein n=1 Tax=Clostridium sp. TaxID=1506 RepID=UPI003F3944EE
MKRLKKLVAIGATVLLGAAMFAGCGSESKEMSTIDKIEENGKIKIGVFSDKPPFGYVNEKGENDGFDVYLGKRLAKDLLGDEEKVEFVLVDAASRVEYLQSDKVDVILANFTVTDERKEKVDFTNPYMKVSLGIVSKDGKVTDVEQLKGKKVIVNKGTTADAFLTKNYPEIELLKFDHNTEAFEALKDGRGDALAHDNTLLFAWARENKGFQVGVKELGGQDTIAPAVKKGNEELLKWINEDLDKLTKEGFLNEAYDKTLKPAYGDDVKPEDVIYK